MVEVACLRANKQYQQQRAEDIPARARVAPQKSEREQRQCQVERPAIEIDEQDGQQLIEDDHPRGDGVLAVEADTLPKAVAVARKEERARRDCRAAGL